MLDKEKIQSRGFKNIEADGKIIGFQVCVRSTYYRGIYLSQLRPATVTVDGEQFKGDQIKWTIGGKTYTEDEMAGIGDVNWALLEPAVITVAKPGGLAQGAHKVQVDFNYSASYMPPAFDDMMASFFAQDESRVLILV